jgi:hypothetical protein
VKRKERKRDNPQLMRQRKNNIQTISQMPTSSGIDKVTLALCFVRLAYYARDKVLGGKASEMNAYRFGCW